MQIVELKTMKLFLVSDEIPKCWGALGLYDLVPFPSDRFPEHFNHEFREDTVYQRLDEIARYLYGDNGRYCEHRHDDCLDFVGDSFDRDCFIPIGDDKYRKIPDLTECVNCNGDCGTIHFVVGNADFSKHLWVVCEYLPSSSIATPEDSECVADNRIAACIASTTEGVVKFDPAFIIGDRE